ncbi:MAG: FAD-dependent oxidoreductase [Bacteroidales bacterium]|nr:FAD-dependent oxidoreductase [Bacteroidales bacterium]
MRALFNTVLLLVLAGNLYGQEYDLIVYGGTASGTIASVAAADEGLSVLLIEPGKNIGGMVTGGLSHNDYGDRTVIGGMALDFYEKVAEYYNKPLYYWRGPEPHIGENIFRDWLEESGVEVLFDKRVMEVKKEHQVISKIVLSDGSDFTAKIFIDATYEGDLMARAGVSYVIGREGVNEYGESWAGRRAILQDGHQMLPRVDPFNEEGDLLPLINPVPLVGEGEADKAVQGYGFRLLVTTDEDNRVPFPKPDAYDPDQFELVKRYYEVHPDAGNMVHIWPTLPNGKTDMNSSGPISTNVVNGLNWEYPDADYNRRDEIWQAMKDYTLCLLYFLSYDPSVPERIHQDTRKMGLCKDEFIENDHWPHQLYIRVARRMHGEYFMTQHDLETDTVKYDAIGMGSYNIDVRHVQRTYIPVSRFPELHYEVYNEGYISIPVAPYQIPFRALLPKFNECTNLIVPVCMSASFIANASIRMEPQYMIMGHAAGIAAAMAVQTERPVQKIDIYELQTKLKEDGQILSLQDNTYGAFNYTDEIIIDNNMKRFTRKTGSWSGNEIEHNGRYQMNYAQNESQKGTFTFRPWIEHSGTYELSIWYPAKETYASRVPVIISHRGGMEEKTINQKKSGGQWISLGRFELERGYHEVVTIIAEDSDGIVVADAVRLLKQ